MAKKILVVDDDVDVLRLLGTRLRPNGYEVVFATDGISCMRKLRSESPDLIILDLGLPAGDGFVTLDRLRNQPDFAHVPVLVLTASEEPNAEDRTRSLGAAAFLRKPVDWEELIATVWRWADAPVAEGA